MAWDLGGDYGKELLRSGLRKSLGFQWSAEILPENFFTGPTILESHQLADRDLQSLFELNYLLNRDLWMRGSSVGSNNWVVS